MAKKKETGKTKEKVSADLVIVADAVTGKMTRTRKEPKSRVVADPNLA